MTPDSSARVVGTPSEGEGECRRLYFLVYLRDSQAMNRRGCESIPVHSLDLRCERLTKCNQFNSIGPVSALRGEGVGEGEGEGEVRGRGRGRSAEGGGRSDARVHARARTCVRARAIERGQRPVAVVRPGWACATCPCVPCVRASARAHVPPLPDRPGRATSPLCGAAAAHESRALVLCTKIFLTKKSFSFSRA